MLMSKMCQILNVIKGETLDIFCQIRTTVDTIGPQGGRDILKVQQKLHHCCCYCCVQAFILFSWNVCRTLSKPIRRTRNVGIEKLKQSLFKTPKQMHLATYRYTLNYLLINVPIILTFFEKSILFSDHCVVSKMRYLSLQMLFLIIIKNTFYSSKCI